MSTIIKGTHGVFSEFHSDDPVFMHLIYEEAGEPFCGLGIESILVESECVFILFKPIHDSAKSTFCFTVNFRLDAGTSVLERRDKKNWAEVHLSYWRDGKMHNLCLQETDSNKVTHIFESGCK